MAAKILVRRRRPERPAPAELHAQAGGLRGHHRSRRGEGFRLWGEEVPALILLDVMPESSTATRSPRRSGPRRALHPRPDHHAHRRGRGRAEIRASAPVRTTTGQAFHPAELLARIRSCSRGSPPRTSPSAARRSAASSPSTGRRVASARRRSRSTSAIALQKELGRRSASSTPTSSSATTGLHGPPVSTGRASSTSRAHRRSTPILLRGILVEHESKIDLLLAAPFSGDGGLVTKEHVAATIDALRGMYDYVVVDVDKRLDDLNLGSSTPRSSSSSS